MIDPSSVSLALISKESVYPREILINAATVGFGEILILTNCDSPHRKQELFQKAKYETLAYQDDDCLAPWIPLLAAADPRTITCAMKPFHIEKYRTSRIALLGWGSIIPKISIYALDHYRAEFGEDEVYRRETERIMTWLNYPQIRLPLEIIDLPSAMDATRLSSQPGHYNYIQIVEDRCRQIATKLGWNTGIQ
jgi:hypothetical protein